MKLLYLNLLLFCFAVPTLKGSELAHNSQEIKRTKIWYLDIELTPFKETDASEIFKKVYKDCPLSLIFPNVYSDTTLTNAILKTVSEFQGNRDFWTIRKAKNIVGICWYACVDQNQSTVMGTSIVPSESLLRPTILSLVSNFLFSKNIQKVQTIVHKNETGGFLANDFCIEGAINEKRYLELQRVKFSGILMSRYNNGQNI